MQRPSLVAGCLCLASAWTVAVPAEPDRVFSTLPSRMPRTLELAEQWRVGGEDDDLIFGTVVQAVTDDAGNVYLLDSQLCHVEVISPRGRHLRTLSGEGDGPGEVRRPLDMVLFPGNNLGLLELFPGKFIRLTLDGDPLSTLVVGGDDRPQTGFIVALGCELRGGTLLVSGQHSVPNDTGQDRVQYLASLTLEGAEKTRFCEASTVLDFQEAHFVEEELLPNFFFARSVGPNGRIYVAPDRDRYAIEVYRPDGSLERVIEREYTARPREERELRRWNALFDTWGQDIPVPTTHTVEPNRRAVAGLRVAPDGILWVEHSRSRDDQPAGVLLTYDTFDRAGRYLQQVSIACEGHPAFDGLEFLEDGRVLLIKGYILAKLASLDARGVSFGEDEESGPMEVICCGMDG